MLLQVTGMLNQQASCATDTMLPPTLTGTSCGCLQHDGPGPSHELPVSHSRSLCPQDSPTIKIGAILGLGLAYAGKRREEVGELLSPLLGDPAVSMEVAAFAALALGLVFVGSCHDDSINSLLQVRQCGPAASWGAAHHCSACPCPACLRSMCAVPGCGGLPRMSPGRSYSGCQ